MSEKPPSLPHDVWLIIFTYVPPNPIEYTRLSEVSKWFYSVFTSDRMWQYLDPYGWKTKVYVKFTWVMNTFEADERIDLRYYWGDHTLLPQHLDKPHTLKTHKGHDKLYCMLGYFCSRRWNVPKIWRIRNEQLLWCAVHIWVGALCWASEELKLSKELILLALERDPELIFIKLNGASVRDKDVALAALEKSEPAGAKQILKHCDSRLLGDFDVMLVAVKKNGLLLELASEELQRNYNLVKAAVSQNAKAILSAKQVTRSLFMDVLPAAWHLLEHFLDFWHDEEIVRLVIPRCPMALWYLPNEWRDNCDIIMLAFKGSLSIFALASDRVKDDFGTVSEVVKRCPMALQYASSSLRDDVKVVLGAIDKNGSSLQYASERLRSESWVVERAMRKFTGRNPSEFSLVPAAIPEPIDEVSTVNEVSIPDTTSHVRNFEDVWIDYRNEAVRDLFFAFSMCFILFGLLLAIEHIYGDLFGTKEGLKTPKIPAALAG